MTTLYVTVGLPGSGKSTWALEQVRASRGATKRINRDSLRDMVHGGDWSQRNEKHIIAARDALIATYLAKGINVIVDDTNLTERHITRLEQLARECDAQLEVVDRFLQVPLGECIKRDLKRPRSVGEDVIRRLHEQHVRPRLRERDSLARRIRNAPAGRKPAILCDLDGTLCLMGDRSPYDEERCDEDRPNAPVVDVVKRYLKDPYKVIFVSGRKEGARDATMRWLQQEELLTPNTVGPFMRAQDDNRPDWIVKRELFNSHIADDYRILFVLDDRQQVVDMWRDLGLTVFQVADGRF